MEYIRITSPAHPWFDRAMALCALSFIREERRDMEEQVRILQDARYHCCAAVREERLQGLVFYWEAEDFLYLEHLCVAPDLRGTGLGTALLSWLRAQGKQVILEIEPPVDELTQNRLHFYEKNGFRMNRHFHIQPKYHVGDPDMEMRILSFGREISGAEYAAFRDFLMAFVQIPGACGR